MMSRDAQVLGEPRAFLRTLAHGVVVNHWRRQDIDSAWLESLAASPMPMAPSPEERLMALETLCRIDAMLDKLNSKARSAFLMSQLDGLTYAEIATRLAVSERMVKKVHGAGHVAMSDAGSAMNVMPPSATNSLAIPTFEHLQHAADWFALLQGGTACESELLQWHRWLDTGPSQRAA
jgi:hypothetical protein